MKGIINDIMEIYSNLDADKQHKLDKLFQEIYNMGVREGYNKQVNEECREKKIILINIY